MTDSIEPDSDRPAHCEEIEITPKMIEAGEYALHAGMGGRLPMVFPAGRDCVRRIFLAMLCAHREREDDARKKDTKEKSQKRR